jgi:hypothetical protein
VVVARGLCACRIGFDATGDARQADGAEAITTITFGERPTSQRKNVTRDTYVDEQTSFNYGNTEDLSVAEFTANAEHTFIRFDVSSIPAGTSVAGARLSLTKVDYGDEMPGTLEVRLLGESWVEGTNNGTPGSGATWLTRDGTTPWTTPGGTATRSLATAATSASVVTIDREVVQQWVDSAAANDGLLVTVTNNMAHVHFHARGSDLLGMTARPELAVDVVQ